MVVVDVEVIVVTVVVVKGTTDQLSERTFAAMPLLDLVSPIHVITPGISTIYTLVHVYVLAHVERQVQR